MRTQKKSVKKSPRKQSERPLAARLGLERLDKLTKRNCLDRVKFLLKNVEKGKYKGELRTKAMKHAYWYKAKAKEI